MNNTQILCFILGWHGGTIHQVAKELAVTTDDILNAIDERMGDLCRLAQKIRVDGLLGTVSAISYAGVPNISQAKRIAQQLRARQVIILVRKDGAGATVMNGASYGTDRVECADAGNMLDRIVDIYEAGDL